MLDKQPILNSGTLLRERYLIRNTISSGLTGAIYLVRDQQLKRQRYNVFALKEIRSLDQQTRYQFAFKGISMRQIQHPALPRIYQVLNDEKRSCIYMVTDYIEGVNLADLSLQHTQNRFSWAELQTLFEPIISALTLLHNQETPLIHGNIKPNNIIQGSSGKLTLVNFGYVQAASPDMLKQTALQAPTPYYAPEYFAGETSISTDIYGLAATFYTLLTGQHPVDALTRQQAELAQKDDPLLLASQFTSGFSTSQAETLQYALNLDPQERFTSVQEFWKLLKTQPELRPQTLSVLTPAPVEQNVPVPVVAPIAEQPVTAKKSRTSLIARLALGALILLFLLGATGTWLWNTASHSATADVSATATSGLTITPKPGTPSHIDGSPNVLGLYTGELTPLGTYTVDFNISILRQTQNTLDGSFAAPSSSRANLKNDRLHGTIDHAGTVHFTIIDSSSNSIVLAFIGGLNDSSPYSHTLGGTFYNCIAGQSTTCIQDKQTPFSGTWVMEQDQTN